MADKNNMQQEHLPGVFPATKKSGEVYFRASLTYRRKHISLGSFSFAEDAHKAYLEGMRILNDSEIDFHEYYTASPLSFEKWISLLNFRDNGIYFGHPIYVGQKLFFML